MRQFQQNRFIIITIYGILRAVLTYYHHRIDNLTMEFILMISGVLLLLLLIAPLIWAGIQAVIFPHQDRLKLFSNYYIGVHALMISLINGFFYSFNHQYMAHFHITNAHTALFTDIGFMHFSIALVAILSLFKPFSFKACICFLYAVLSIFQAMELLFIYPHNEAIVLVTPDYLLFEGLLMLANAMVFFIFYFLLSEKNDFLF